MIGRVGIDSYGLFPLGLGPVGLLDWARRHGAAGVHVSGFAPEEQLAIPLAVLDDTAAAARDLDLYLEWGGAQHIPRDAASWARKDLTAHNRTVVGQAARLGCRVVRSCSSGLMRWGDAAPPTETLMAETAGALIALRPMLEDHGLVLAVETHFEFTSFELLRLFDRCDVIPGGCLGICLDTMNLLTMLEEPGAATGRLLPWVVATHVKDGGVLVDEAGLVTFPVPIGEGIVDLAGIISLLDRAPATVNLSVEAHAGSFRLPIFDPTFLSRFPDLTTQELAGIVELAAMSASRPECRPSERATWRDVCEARMVSDLAALNAVIGRAAGGA